MKVMGLNIPVVAVVFLLSLSGLILGQGVAYRYFTERPLQMAFDGIEGVEGFEIVDDEGQIYVQVKLGDVDNLRDVYKQIYSASRKHIGKGFKDIIIKDERDSFLEEVYYSIHFDVQEAIATGNFSRMAGEIEEKTTAAGIDKSRIYVDNDRLFIELHEGKKYLYEMIPRGVPSRGEAQGSNEEPGGINGGGRKL